MLGQKSCCMRRAFSLLSVHFWETSLVCSSEIEFFSVLCSSLIMFRYLLSVLQSHSLIVSCLSLSHLCNPPLHHLQLISTNNDYSRALVQSYKLMHTQAWCPRGVHKQTAHWTVLRDAVNLKPCVVWTWMCVGCVGDDSWVHCNSHLSARGKTTAS